MAHKKNIKKIKIRSILCADFKEEEHLRSIISYKINNIDNIKDYKSPQKYKTGNIENVLDYIIAYIIQGFEDNYIPVICGFNMYDYTRAIIYELRNILEVKVVAKNESNFFTATFYYEEEIVLKLWDVMHLVDEETLYKETKQKDLLCAIPEYIKLLLLRNDFIKEKDLSFSVLTKASLTRQYAKKLIGKLTYINAHGHEMKLIKAHHLTCVQNQPYNYKCHALRKACSIGGYNFVSANNSNKIQSSVINIDANSMHHAHICGHFVPVSFRPVPQKRLDFAIKEMQEMDKEYILKRYDRPFHKAFHVKVQIKNVRLKKDSVFEKNAFGLLHRENFKEDWNSTFRTEKQMAQERQARKQGYKFIAKKYKFAYGKLLSAKDLIIFVNEIEMWNFLQVYDFDSYKVIFGEMATRFVRPTDFITLQTNLLYKTKKEFKKIIKDYRPGKCYQHRVPKEIPRYLKERLKAGSATKEELNNYYLNDVKARFNCVYGNQAQDIYLPDYDFDNDFKLSINRTTITTSKNFIKKLREKQDGLLVHYNYGTRIATWSRTHLIIALLQLYEFDNNIKIISGDTDSIHFCSNKPNILSSLSTLHKATDKAIDKTLERARSVHPKQCTNLKGLGHFEIEGIDRKRIDYSNKVYLTQAQDMSIELTCAGLPQNENNKWNIKRILQYFCKKYSFEEVAQKMFGFNTYIKKEIADCLVYVESPRIYIKDTQIALCRKYQNTGFDLLSIGKLENCESLLASGKFEEADIVSNKIVGIKNEKPIIECVNNLGEVIDYV